MILIKMRSINGLEATTFMAKFSVERKSAIIIFLSEKLKTKPRYGSFFFLYSQVDKKVACNRGREKFKGLQNIAHEQRHKANHNQ